MKYYLLHGLPDQIDNKRFEILKGLEPTVEELTFKQYENIRGFKKGTGGKHDKGVGQRVDKDAAAQDGTSFSVEGNTKKEIIAEIERIGTTIARTELNKKNKKELMELL